MKIRLEKPAVNISKLTGGKNEKPRRGALHEKFPRFTFPRFPRISKNRLNTSLVLATFIVKVVTLIFLVLAEYELKKMWSKFDNGTPDYGT